MAVSYRIEVSETLEQETETVYPYLSDLAKFMEWNPFPEMDPTTESTLSQETAGVGATLSWQGKRIGSGEMKLVNYEANNSATYAMKFGNEPKAEHATSTLSITDAPGGGSVVTWLLTGERRKMNAVMVKLIGLDKMMAKNFAFGLTKLTRVLNSPA